VSYRNPSTATRVEEIGAGIYRISTPAPDVAGGFSFNQYLLVDDEPLLFHAGPRALAAAVIDAIGHVIPIERLRWIGFAHVEADECGGLNSLLAAAPNAAPVCSQVAAMVSVADLADRPPRALADGEILTIGSKELEWIDAPFVPHGWENGFLHERVSATLLCGDLLTQPGTGGDAIVEHDILATAEAFRGVMDYYSHSPRTDATIRRLAALQPRTLACMHGSAWRGDGGALLTALADAVAGR
jgi:flavorubredoxin